MMKIKHVIICILILALLPAARSARAEEGQAEDLSDGVAFDFGRYEEAEARVRQRSDRYQTFEKGDSFTLTWDDALVGARLAIQWQTAPQDVCVLQYGEADRLLCRTTLGAYPETITNLLPDARKAVVFAGDGGMQVLFCSVYGDGILPDPFLEWQDTPDHVDYMLISTHPDDDVLWLGSIVPTYGAERGYTGTIVYVTNQTRERINEAENGAWAMGLRYRPVFLGMTDVANTASAERKKLFRYDELLLNTVRIYRRYRPLVVFAQDEKGEYGHWQHKLTSKASREAFRLAADEGFDPESAALYGTWQVQKLYLHLYKKNKLTVDAHAPLSAFDGRDALSVARKAYKAHQSQQKYHFRVDCDNAKYAFNRFGMAEGVVPAGEDVFDNIDETLLCGYELPPAPEPTAATVPEPTPEPAMALPAAKQTLHADTRETPAPKPPKKDATPLIWIGAVTVGLALTVGVAAYFWKKRQIERKETEP